MTQDEMIELARQAGAHDNGYEVRFVEPKYLERFAKLVAEKEREECAKVAENMDAMILALLNETRQPIAIAAAIRARGQE